MSFFANLVADLLDSTQMYLRDATAIDQAHQVLTFFGWQQVTGRWTHPDIPGLRATLSTDDGKLSWRLTDVTDDDTNLL